MHNQVVIHLLPGIYEYFDLPVLVFSISFHWVFPSHSPVDFAEQLVGQHEFEFEVAADFSVLWEWYVWNQGHVTLLKSDWCVAQVNFHTHELEFVHLTCFLIKLENNGVVKIAF